MGALAGLKLPLESPSCYSLVPPAEDSLELHDLTPNPGLDA